MTVKELRTLLNYYDGTAPVYILDSTHRRPEPLEGIELRTTINQNKDDPELYSEKVIIVLVSEL